MAIIPRSSYYDRHRRQSAALIRARQPYLVRNAVTGVAIMGFAFCVYSYTIHAVGTDEFEDVPVPAGPKTMPPGVQQTPAEGAATGGR